MWTKNAAISLSLALGVIASVLHPRGCNANNCLRAFRNNKVAASASSFCTSFLSASTPTSTTPSPLPSYASNCDTVLQLSSACSCLLAGNGSSGPTSTPTNTGTSTTYSPTAPPTTCPAPTTVTITPTTCPSVPGTSDCPAPTTCPSIPETTVTVSNSQTTETTACPSISATTVTVTSPPAGTGPGTPPPSATCNVVANPGFESGDLTSWGPAPNPFGGSYALGRVIRYADSDTVEGRYVWATPANASGVRSGALQKPPTPLCATPSKRNVLHVRWKPVNIPAGEMCEFAPCWKSDDESLSGGCLRDGSFAVGEVWKEDELVMPYNDERFLDTFRVYFSAVCPNAGADTVVLVDDIRIIADSSVPPPPTVTVTETTTETVTATASSTAICCAPGHDEVVNGGFEDGLSPWTSSGGPGAQRVCDVEGASSSGRCSFLLDPSLSPGGTLEQRFTTCASGFYTLTFRYAMEGNSGCFLVVNLLGDDPITQLYSPTQGQWRSASRNSGDRGQNRGVRFSVSNGCVAHIDEVAYVRS